MSLPVHLLHVDDPPLLLLDSRFIKAFMVVLVMTPISMLRNISKLEKVQKLSFLVDLQI